MHLGPQCCFLAMRSSDCAKGRRSTIPKPARPKGVSQLAAAKLTELKSKSIEARLAKRIPHHKMGWGKDTKLTKGKEQKA